jgi:hypothetical protein
MFIHSNFGISFTFHVKKTEILYKAFI